MLACNPAAGNFSPRSLARLRAALERDGHAVTTADSLEFEIPAAPDAVDLVCIVGGDGTARTVIGRNRAAARNAAFCVYPAGTVNLLAREAGYPASAGAFASRVLQAGNAARHFMGEIDGQPFLCCASVGPDSAVVARVSPDLKRRFGRLAYVFALLGQLRNWTRQRMEVTVDGTVHEAEAVFIFKGRFYAGPWVLDDAADLRSDQFRILLLKHARRRDILRLAISAMISPRLGDKRWQRLSAREIQVAAPIAMPIQADGDILAVTPATIAIVPEPLSFV